MWLGWLVVCFKSFNIIYFGLGCLVLVELGWDCGSEKGQVGKWDGLGPVPVLYRVWLAESSALFMSSGFAALAAAAEHDFRPTVAGGFAALASADDLRGSAIVAGGFGLLAAADMVREASSDEEVPAAPGAEPAFVPTVPGPPGAELAIPVPASIVPQHVVMPIVNRDVLEQMLSFHIAADMPLLAVVREAMGYCKGLPLQDGCQIVKLCEQYMHPGSLLSNHMTISAAVSDQNRTRLPQKLRVISSCLSAVDRNVRHGIDHVSRKHVASLLYSMWMRSPTTRHLWR